MFNNKEGTQSIIDKTKADIPVYLFRMYNRYLASWSGQPVGALLEILLRKEIQDGGLLLPASATVKGLSGRINLH